MPETRYAGFEGAVYLASGGSIPGNRITWIFNWSLEVVQETQECAIKGDRHDTYESGGVSSRVTAERFMGDVATGGFPYSGPSAITKRIVTNAPPGTLTMINGVTVVFYLYGINKALTADAPAAGAYIHGEGLLVRTQIQNPRGGATEQFEIQSIVMPTISQ